MHTGSNETDSEPSDEGREINGKTCAVCGESIETTEWHPIDIDVDAEDDGEVQLYTFCSQVCRAAWERD